LWRHVVDGEHFTFTVDVKAGQAKIPDATLMTSYEPMIAVADGQMSLDEFARQHLEMSGSNPEKAQALAQLMGRAMMRMTGAAA